MIGLRESDDLVVHAVDLDDVGVEELLMQRVDSGDEIQRVVPSNLDDVTRDVVVSRVVAAAKGANEPGPITSGRQVAAGGMSFWCVGLAPQFAEAVLLDFGEPDADLVASLAHFVEDAERQLAAVGREACRDGRWDAMLLNHVVQQEGASLVEVVVGRSTLADRRQEVSFGTELGLVAVHLDAAHDDNPSHLT